MKDESIGKYLIVPLAIAYFHLLTDVPFSQIRAQLTLNARNLARLIWIHGRERDGEEGVDDLLASSPLEWDNGRREIGVVDGVMD